MFESEIRVEISIDHDDIIRMVQKEYPYPIPDGASIHFISDDEILVSWRVSWRKGENELPKEE